jgi:hypothetical protein
MTALKSSYKKAVSKYPDFAQSVKLKLAQLRELEEAKTQSLDKAADNFAVLLACAAEGISDDVSQRIKYQILYHIGRIVYIVDAYQDIEEDMTAGRFNPIVSRFKLETETVPQEVKQSVKQTLDDSINVIFADYELMKKNYWDSIISNILYDAIPDMCLKVLNNTYSTKLRGLPKYPKPQIGGNK